MTDSECRTNVSNAVQIATKATAAALELVKVADNSLTELERVLRTAAALLPAADGKQLSEGDRASMHAAQKEWPELHASMPTLRALVDQARQWLQDYQTALGRLAIERSDDV